MATVHPPTDRPLFAADSIGKSFRGAEVLRTASVWAEPGQVTALLGRNGSGKTTLLRVGAGVLAPDFGAVHFRGDAHVRPRLYRLARRGLFFLPDRDLLSPRWTLARHLKAVRWGFGTGDPADDPVDPLRELDAEPLLRRRPRDMSGGERRRAELVVAWTRRPLCLLADEPFTGIGPRDAEVVAGVLRAMAARGCAIVVTGHEVREILAIADQVVWMTAGTTHALGTPADARRHAQFRREYLGPAGGL